MPLSALRAYADRVSVLGTKALFHVGDGRRPRGSSAGRALSAIAEEVRSILDEGVVAEPQDIDLCLIAGAGWQFHLGGITPYLDRSGIAESTTGAFLPPDEATHDHYWCECQGNVLWRFRYFTSSGGR